MMNIKILSLAAGTSSLLASVEAGLPDADTLDSLGRWPVTVILGAVCVACVYFIYKQSKDNAERSSTVSRENNTLFLEMVSGERLATEHRVASNAQATKELAENNARVVKELADNHARNLQTLLDEIRKQSENKVNL
jgi:hypothetical protein